MKLKNYSFKCEKDDIDEFVEASEQFNPDKDNGFDETLPLEYREKPPAIPGLKIKGDDDDDKPKVGQPCQYALYEGGYTPTYPTIKTLPAGCYDIMQDNRGVTFAQPALKPVGLLLELPQMRSDEVIKLVEVFWDSEKDYKEGNQFVRGGAAYKSGIMLYGPPGTGKTCTIKIVSNKLVDRGGIVFNASRVGPQALNSFLKAFTVIEKNRKIIVVFEDFDSLIQTYGENAYLAMLDSAESIDNVMFIATTNYPDRLDPRVHNRPGRFSHVIKIGAPGPEARAAYLKAILKDHRDVEKIVKESHNFSIDHLTAIVNAVYREKKDLDQELGRLRRLFKLKTAEEDKKIGF